MKAILFVGAVAIALSFGACRSKHSDSPRVVGTPQTAYGKAIDSAKGASAQQNQRDDAMKDQMNSMSDE